MPEGVVVCNTSPLLYLHQVAPILGALQQTSMWLSRDLITWVLREAGEE